MLFWFVYYQIFIKLFSFIFLICFSMNAMIFGNIQTNSFHMHFLNLIIFDNLHYILFSDINKR